MKRTHSRIVRPFHTAEGDSVGVVEYPGLHVADAGFQPREIQRHTLREACDETLAQTANRR